MTASSLASWKSAARVAYLVATVVVALAAVKSFSVIASSPGGSRAALSVAVSLMIMQVVMIGMAWHTCIAAMAGQDAALKHSIRSFVTGWLVRYFPGPMAPQASKLVVLRRAGIPGGAIGGALAYEQVQQIAACLAVPLFLAPVYVELLPGLLLAALGVAVLGGLGLVPASPTAARALHKMMRFSTRPMSVRESVMSQLMLLAGSLLGALAFHFVAVSLGVSSGSGLRLNLFAFAAGSLVGFVAPLLPAGAGAREAVIVALLAATVGSAPALEAAVLTRGLAVIIDAGLGAMFLLVVAIERVRASVAYAGSRVEPESVEKNPA